MRALLLTVALAATLPGCLGFSGGDAGIPESIKGVACSDAYSREADRQVIVQVLFHKEFEAYGDAQFHRIEVAAQREGEEYDTSRPDGAGCLRFAMHEPGGYMFWAFGETDRAECFWSGYFSGDYDGTPLVKATVTVKRICA